MDVKEKLVELLGRVQQMGVIYRENQMDERYPTIEQILNTEVAARLIANGVTVQECGNWKYYHKQNKAVCTSCGFERDLDTNFSKAIACPNCGAYMTQPQKGE